MRQRMMAAVALALVAATGLTACGDDSGDAGGGSGGGGEKITIGIKFDQPGLGLKEGSNYTGFDVEVAKYVAKELGYSEDNIEFKESPSAQREDLIANGQVKLIFATYSITDKRKEKVDFAGPYYVAEEVPDERIVLRRNPNYGGSRPRRVREIRVTMGIEPSRAVADVEAGRADYIWELPPDRDAEAELVARYGPASGAAREGTQRYFVNPTMSLGYLALNTSRPLFSDARMRQAVNYAIDRRALARHGHLRLTGDFPAIPTDQYLPPTMPGASRAPLYPPGGDLRAARRLAPDVEGTAVLYTCDHPHCREQAQVIKSNLKALGLDVDVREFQFLELFERAGTKGEPFDMITGNWLADYVDPADFLNILLDQHIRPRGNLNLSYFVDPELTRNLERVAGLSGEPRYRAYAALSVELARDAAPWVAYSNGAYRDFFSARIGCQTFQPVYGMDLGALCIHGKVS